MFDDAGKAIRDDVLSRLAGLVDELQELDLTGLPAEELLGLLRGLETQRRRLASVDHRLIGEVESRDLARELGCATTTVLLRQLLRIATRREQPGPLRD